MIVPSCPICALPLHMQAAVWRCDNGHSFDVARQGYVNLLTVSQKHSLHPGDSQKMVAARRSFLNAGYYVPIVQTLRSLVRRYAPNAKAVLDVGCGEGYYLSQIEAEERWGIDISKDAVRYAAVRDKTAHWLTATAAHLPFAEDTFDCILSMFALTVPEEFRRVLRPGGAFIQVLAGEAHLLALRSIIYPTVREKAAPEMQTLTGFQLLHSETLRFDFRLNTQQEVQSLLYMTPHAWRISREGARSLERVEQLVDCAEAVFHVFAAES